MKILLAGGSGVLGREIAKALAADGHEVSSLGRGPANEVRADLLDRDAVMRAVDGLRFDAVVHAATALANTSLLRHKEMHGTDDLRLYGTPHLIEAAQATGATRFVSESMMFGYGYGDFGDRPLREDRDEFGPKGRNAEFERHVGAMRVKEQLTLGTPGLEGVALRFGLFYGPGVTDTLVLPLLRKRQLPVVADHGRKLAWVQVPDAARAVALAVTKGRPGQAYNIADDGAVSWGDHVRGVAEAFGTPRPMQLPIALLRPFAPLASEFMSTNLRLDSSLAHRELGWTAEYPDSVAAVRAMAGLV